VILPAVMEPHALEKQAKPRHAAGEASASEANVILDICTHSEQRLPRMPSH